MNSQNNDVEIVSLYLHSKEDKVKESLSKLSHIKSLIYSWDSFSSLPSHMHAAIAELLESHGKEKSLLCIIKIENGKWNLLHYRVCPDEKYDWGEVVTQFEKNYRTTEPDEGFWRVGQIVQTSGEYMCRECGYIESFQQGDIFIPCEVCAAGDPDGPSEPATGVWQLI